MIVAYALIYLLLGSWFYVVLTRDEDFELKHPRDFETYAITVIFWPLLVVARFIERWFL